MRGRVFTIVPAAGSALRMGLGYSKAYLDILGVPLLARTLRSLLESPLLDRILTAVRPGETELCQKQILDKFDLAGKVDVIAGGDERQHTVASMLSRITPDRDLILIHDGARPFVTPHLVKEVLEAAAKWGAAVSAVPVGDTVKLSEDNGQTVASTLDRDKIFLVQTPQAFQKDVLVSAHRRARKADFTGTDDASIVEWTGHSVRIVRGDHRNLKITTLEDLEQARWIIDSKESES